MTTKLFLHAGAAKCASTSIQRFIFDNTSVLNGLGFAVSDDKLKFDGRGDNPLWLIEKIINGQEPNIIAERLAAARKPNVIIAAENLQNTNAPRLFSDLGDLEIHVLVVVRRQDDWAYSSWKQWHSKMGRSLEQYVDFALEVHEPDFPAIVDAWKSIATSVTVESLDFLGDRTIPDVVLSWLGLSREKDRFSYKDVVYNESFDFRILDLLSRQSEIYKGPHDLGIENFLAKYSRLSSKEKFRLSDQLSDRIMDAYHADNVKLFGEERAARLRLMPKKKGEVAKSGRSLEGHDFLIACLLEAMNNMATTVDDLQKQLSRPRKTPSLTRRLCSGLVEAVRRRRDTGSN